MTLNIYRYGCRFLPDSNVVFTCGGTCHDEMIILSRCCLRGFRESTLYGPVDANSYPYSLDHLFSTPMCQDLTRLPIVNPEDVDLPMVASADHGPSHFSKYTTFHKPSICVDCKCSCRCGAIGEVEIKPVIHIIDQSASTQSTNIDIST